MEDMKDVLPLRLIAARFISSDEQAGIIHLDRIAAHASRTIHRRYWVLRLALGATALATMMTLLPGIFLTLSNAPGATTVVMIGLMCFALMMLTIIAWRVFQYGGLKATTPQSALYADRDDPAARNLERLFALLQTESSPRAFFRIANGGRRYVDHRYFFGKLRAAHVAPDSMIRSALFSPVGSWFDRELFLEADVERLIAEAKAEPSRAGAPRKYDYTDAVISLIEHPQVRAIDTARKRGNQKLIIRLLEDWYRTRRLEVPGETQLSGYAKQILETIAKNRSA
ncbi:hypothetical protein [Blastomonas sp.]|uniref:hypothetical protein n=1 Tax=Blastomonas sp. TaxID=1909299 RepID=UPI00391A27A5